MATRDRSEQSKQTDFPIVGIGASAGGLEALEAFVSEIAPESGMAFVVVSHSHPDHKTRLPEILERKATVPVVLLKDGMRLGPDMIYIPPSDLDPSSRWLDPSAKTGKQDRAAHADRHFFAISGA